MVPKKQVFCLQITNFKNILSKTFLLNSTLDFLFSSYEQEESRGRSVLNARLDWAMKSHKRAKIWKKKSLFDLIWDQLSLWHQRLVSAKQMFLNITVSRTPGGTELTQTSSKYFARQTCFPPTWTKTPIYPNTEIWIPPLIFRQRNHPLLPADFIFDLSILRTIITSLPSSTYTSTYAIGSPPIYFTPERLWQSTR